MYQVVHLWLEPTAAQMIALQQTMETVNTARNEISAVAYYTGTFRLQALTDLCVEDSSMRLGLSLAMTYRCVATVVEAYRNQRHIQQRFHPGMSIPYDRQTLRIDAHEQSVTLWTVIGWQAIPYVTEVAFLDRWSFPKLMQLRGAWALLLVVPGQDGELLRRG